MMDSVERYIRGEMLPDERVYFEQLRKTNAEVDQMVVEQTIFFQQMNRFNEWKKFKSSLQDIHTAAIAASIAGITAIGLSILLNSFGPHKESPRLQALVSEVNNLKNVTR